MGKKLHRNRVLAIREQYDAGISVQEIADGFGYHRNTISDIVNGRTHKRVRPGAVPPFPVKKLTAEEQTRRAEQVAKQVRRRQ